MKGRMNARQTSRLWLLLCPVLLALIDCGITLQGQSSDYWRGNFTVVREGNAIGRTLLMYGPIYCTLFEILLHTPYIAAICFLPSSLAVVISLLVTLAHMLGAATWMTLLGLPGWVLIVLLFFCTQRLFSYSLKQSNLHSYSQLPHPKSPAEV